MNPRKIPYGYRAEGKKLLKDEAQQRIIREIVEHSIILSPQMIATDLNRRGVKTQRGGRWHKSTIIKILTANSKLVDEMMAKRGIEVEEREKPALPFPKHEAFFEYGEDCVDPETGEVHREVSLIRSSEGVEARAKEFEKVKQIAKDEGAATFYFHELQPTALATSIAVEGNNEVAQIVTDLTKRTGKDAHALLDQIEGQPGVKGQLRKVFKFLLWEIALQRHVNLHLRDTARRQSAEIRATAVKAREAREARPSSPPSPPIKQALTIPVNLPRGSVQETVTGHAPLGVEVRKKRPPGVERTDTQEKEK